MQSENNIGSSIPLRDSIEAVWWAMYDLDCWLSVTPTPTVLTPFNLSPLNQQVPLCIDPPSSPALQPPMAASSTANDHSTPNQMPTLARPSNMPTRPLCSYCGRKHTRPVRYQECQNRHTGAKPFSCQGVCGQSGCMAAFSSREQLRRHLLPDCITHVRCKRCGHLGWRQNAARHEKTCSSSIF